MTLVTRIRTKALRRYLGAVGLMALAALLTSCDDGPATPSDLMGGEWRLEELRLAGGTSVAPPDSTRFTLNFASDDQIEVRADCNGCGGRYSLDDESLVVSDLACTLIACPSAPLDGQYLAILDGASSVDVDDEELTVESSRGRLRFTR